LVLTTANSSLKLIINFFAILGVAEDDVWMCDRVILCLILGLESLDGHTSESLDGHTSESWQGTNLDEWLE